MRRAAYLLRKGAPVPMGSEHLPRILAAVLDQEAVWAEDRADRYPADKAPVLALTDAIASAASQEKARSEAVNHAC